MSKRQRLRVFVWSANAVFVVAVVWLAFNADWEALEAQFFQLDDIKAVGWEIVTVGMRNTALFTLFAFSAGSVLGLILAIMKLSPVASFRWFASIYIEIFRALPAILTIIIFAFSIPIAFRGVNIPFAPLGAGLVGLTVVAAAYIAENIRAGIEAVPKGQVEAARSLGMSPTRTMITIVIPQAIRIVIPPLTNELILLIKDTSLLFVAGSTPALYELLLFGRSAQRRVGSSAPLIVAGLLYIALTIPLTFLVRRLEGRAKAAR